MIARLSASFVRAQLLSWVVAVSLASLGCGAVYPEVKTPLEAVPEGRTLKPAPPPELLYIAFAEARIPAKTRDGRQWDRVGGNAPDAEAILFLNDKELIRTPVHGNTLRPTWPNQKRKNYRIPKGSKIRVELWDSNPINDRPICIHNVVGIHSAAFNGQEKVKCASGAEIVLTVEPAHARYGLGLYYELRTRDIFVSRVIRESPAARAGLKRGVQIVRIEGKDVREMEEGEAQSKINANADTGVKLTVKFDDGTEKEVSMRSGPVYPDHTEPVDID